MKRLLLKYLRSQKINWFKTLLINFKCLPFSQARHLPIYVFSDTIISSYGHIVIKADAIHSGMIKIGRANFFKGHKTYFVNAGTIEFHGRFMVEGGSTINNMGGYITLGPDSRICEVCKVLVMGRLEVGKSTQIAFGSIIMDTDFHTVIDISDKKVRRPCMPIKIGAYNWFGNNCHIMKGTKTPDYAIVTAKSLCNKDYTQYPLYSVFAGTPAKWLAEGKRRVYNKESCKIISKRFAESNNMNSILLSDDISDWDSFCLGGDEVLFSED